MYNVSKLLLVSRPALQAILLHEQVKLTTVIATKRMLSPVFGLIECQTHSDVEYYIFSLLHRFIMNM